MLLIARRLRTESLTWIAARSSQLDEPSRVWLRRVKHNWRWCKNEAAESIKITKLSCKFANFSYAEIQTRSGRILSSKSEIDRKWSNKEKCRCCSAFLGSRREEKLWRFLSPQRFYWNIFPSTISASIIASRSSSWFSWSCIINASVALIGEHWSHS